MILISNNASRIHREVYVRFWEGSGQTCHSNMVRRLIPTLPAWNRPLGNDKRDLPDLCAGTFQAERMAERGRSSQSTGPDPRLYWKEEQGHCAGRWRRCPLPDDRRQRCRKDCLLLVPQSRIRLRQRHELPRVGHKRRPCPELWDHSA